MTLEELDGGTGEILIPIRIDGEIPGYPGLDYLLAMASVYLESTGTTILCTHQETTLPQRFHLPVRSIRFFEPVHGQSRAFRLVIPTEYHRVFLDDSEISPIPAGHALSSGIPPVISQAPSLDALTYFEHYLSQKYP